MRFVAPDAPKPASFRRPSEVHPADQPKGLVALPLEHGRDRQEQLIDPILADQLPKELGTTFRKDGAIALGVQRIEAPAGGLDISHDLALELLDAGKLHLRPDPVEKLQPERPVIQVSGVRKTYGPTVAVDEVSFDVADGEIFGLIGPNGAGKTTTMECVEGLRSPDRGTISVLGLDPFRDVYKLQNRVGVQLAESRASKLASELPTLAVSRVTDVRATSQLASPGF